MIDGWFNRLSTSALAATFCAVLVVLLLATGASIAHMQNQARFAEDRSAARQAAAAR
ncbi:MAG: hypothetical protein H7125_17545, partial [Proteobacteria bacterium]|nr:hypothetical protein [Burkholderiales bacterium]